MDKKLKYKWVDVYVNPFLKKSKQLYTVITDLSGKYLYTNLFFKDTFYFQEKEIMQKDFANAIWYEDIQLCINASAKCVENPSVNQLLKIRKPNENKDGYLWTSWELSALKNEKNQVFGILCVGYDLTNEIVLTSKLRTEGRRSKSFFENTSEFNVLLDEHKNILDFNDAAKEEARQHYNIELAKGNSILPFITENYKSKFEIDFKKALEGSKSHRKIKIDFDVNTTVWYEIDLYPTLDKNNHKVQVLLSSKNIDEQVQAEIELEKQIQKIEDIIWTQSHIVRSPLSNVLGLISLMIENKNDLSEKEINFTLNSIQSEATKLDSIMREKVGKATQIA